MPQRADVATDCVWAQPIRFAEPTKAWLRGLFSGEDSPLPDVPGTLRGDLEQVARHNDKHAAFCG